MLCVNQVFWCVMIGDPPGGDVWCVTRADLVCITCSDLVTSPWIQLLDLVCF